MKPAFFILLGTVFTLLMHINATPQLAEAFTIGWILGGLVVAFLTGFGEGWGK